MEKTKEEDEEEEEEDVNERGEGGMKDAGEEAVKILMEIERPINKCVESEALLRSTAELLKMILMRR